MNPFTAKNRLGRTDVLGASVMIVGALPRNAASTKHQRPKAQIMTSATKHNPVIFIHGVVAAATRHRRGVTRARCGGAV